MKNTLNSILVFIIFVLIYSLGTFEKIPFGDCVGQVVDVETSSFIKIATPTSHFLYTNAAIVIKNMMNIDGLLAVRLLVILSGAFVVAVIYRTADLITQTSWIALTTAFVFGFSFTFWRNAEIVEVYTFNMVWVALFLHFLLKTFFSVQDQKRSIVMAALFLSVSLWTHIENIFFIPSLLLLIFYFKNLKSSLLLSLLLIIGSVMIMMGINALEDLPAKSIIKSERGTWIEDTFKKMPVEYLKDLVQSVAYLLYNFNVFVVAGIVGVVRLYEINRRLFFVLSCASILIYGFSTFYAVSDNYVFFLPFNYMFALGTALGILSFKNQKRASLLSPICILIPVIYFIAPILAAKIPKAQAFQKRKAYKGGLQYYLVPWMNDNVGILEFTIENREATDPVNWMTDSAEEYIQILKSKGYTTEEIKKL